MPLTTWNTKKIKQYNLSINQALLTDESTLDSFSQDFGKLKQSKPAAVVIPKDTQEIQKIIEFAYKQALPVTIRGNGLSQNGQSLSVAGGLILSMEALVKILAISEDTVWVEANVTWSKLLEITLAEQKSPPVLPYNCNLSIGGVLSAGGIGASSFKYGALAAQVQALEVVDGTGKIHIVDKDSQLFHACLGGQGQFGVITKACIQLKPVKKKVQTFYLVYQDQRSCLADYEELAKKANYMELFCSPSIQGLIKKGSTKKPLVQWLYGLHVSLEYDKSPPTLEALPKKLRYWQCLHIQTDSIEDYLHRHNPRFEAMKNNGQWSLIHPWYECFVPIKVIRDNLEKILEDLPPYYATVVHIVPIINHSIGLLMLPEDEQICSFMILHPGIPESLKAGCLEAIQNLDKFFLSKGGKRYLSGYIGETDERYWKKHYGKRYKEWVKLKKDYDPEGIFCSLNSGSDLGKK